MAKSRYTIRLTSDEIRKAKALKKMLKPRRIELVLNKAIVRLAAEKHISKLEAGGFTRPNINLLLIRGFESLSNEFDVRFRATSIVANSKLAKLPTSHSQTVATTIEQQLSDALLDGCRVLTIDGVMYVYIEDGGWRQTNEKDKHSARKSSEGIWEEGPIISRNLGPVVVRPYKKNDGNKVVGYTRGTGGSSPLRNQPVKITANQLRRAKKND